MKVGFWLIISGWANRDIAGKEEKKIFVGKVNSPIAVIKRGDIKDYLTGELSEMYSVWLRFKDGFGLPFSSCWGDYPDRFIDILSMFNTAWKEASNGHNS